MPIWEVRFEREFDKDFIKLDKIVQLQMLACLEVLERRGPSLGRPLVDTLADSAYSNMKELRFSMVDGEWRVALAFDPKSRAVVLVAGNKMGLWNKNEDKFYGDLIYTADTRFKAYLARIKKDDA